MKTPPTTCRDSTPGVARVIVVDDETGNRSLCREALRTETIPSDEACDGVVGLRLIARGGYALALLDVDMPAMSGIDVLRHLRENPPCAHFKVIMMSGRASGDEMAQMMQLGADDYLTKPFSVVQMRERVKAALRLKAAQDRSDLFNRNLITVNRELEQGILARDSDLINARNALVLSLAELVGHRDAETGAHLMRMQHYTRILAEHAARSPSYATQIDADYINLLECCAPLHDIGKVGIPDHILQKPGPLTPLEREIMQTHTVIAATTLEKVAQRHGFALALFRMAAEVARSHHERFDGRGYPDRLVGDNIPLSARLIAIADVYDAIRSKRVYKPARPHAEAMSAIIDDKGHFDPSLLESFRRCEADFARVFHDFAD